MNPTDKVMLAVAVLVVAGLGAIGAYYLTLEDPPAPIEVTVYYTYGSIEPIPYDPGSYVAEHILYTDGCPEGTEYNWDDSRYPPTYGDWWDPVDEPVEVDSYVIWGEPLRPFVPYLHCPGYVFNVVKI